MKLGYFALISLIVFTLLFAVLGLFGPVFAHSGVSVDEDGCHECRSEDGCLFFNYWSVPYVRKHCHGLPATSTIHIGFFAATSTTKVIEVLQGDLLEVEFSDGDTAEIRLLGVQNPDAHESHDASECKDARLRYSKESLEDIVLDKEVRLALDDPDEIALRASNGAGDEESFDEEGNILVYVYQDELFVNEEMIKNGYAYRNASSTHGFSGEFEEIEKEARESLLGLWDKEFCEWSERNFIAMLFSQISSFGGLSRGVKFLFVVIAILGIYILGRLIRRVQSRAE